ncbi:hypothetical protein [Spongiactinospora sp. TRM90649]|uniref:hypothetical protein n=1 Tax=Spongiactinospora sp. TRM90649 TaxID=3031114 RepID=UPI0023F7C4A3|nr:hypothetical protein [Spongiactinospora sp. TRM90649]MDF5756658.1 hypothetical protein [Spongiactinospora sp. TRM90649]
MAKSGFDAKLSPAALEAKSKRAAVHGLTKAVEHLRTVSQGRVPVDNYDLHDTAWAGVDESALQGVVSYSTPYAVYQHEVEELDHDPGRTWKYLENPAHEEAEVMRALVAAELRRAFRK